MELFEMVKMLIWPHLRSQIKSLKRVVSVMEKIEVIESLQTSIFTPKQEFERNECHHAKTNGL